MTLVKQLLKELSFGMILRLSNCDNQKYYFVILCQFLFKAGLFVSSFQCYLDYGFVFNIYKTIKNIALVNRNF